MCAISSKNTKKWRRKSNKKSARSWASLHTPRRSGTKSAKIRPTWYIGPYGSLLYSIHETEFLELPGYPACCTENRSGNGLGYDIGLLLHIPMQDIGLRFYFGMNSPSGTIYADQKIGNQFQEILNHHSTP